MHNYKYLQIFDKKAHMITTEMIDRTIITGIINGTEQPLLESEFTEFDGSYETSTCLNSLVILKISPFQKHLLLD